MKNRFFSVLLLLTYAAVTIATSVKPVGADYLQETRNYSVTSNCGNASLTTGQISVTGATITAPSATTFLSTGIPTETLNIGEDVSGDLAPALTRSCQHSLDNTLPNLTISVYTCADNGIPACIVNFTHLN